MSDAIRVDRAGRRADVVLDRGEKRNALTLAMWRELARTFRDLDADDDLRCIVLRGSGEQDFSAGADISEFQSVRSDRAQAREYGATVESAIAAIAECRHPTVAAIRGACVGGGLELAAVCDIRIATSSSRLGAPVSRIGVTMAPAEMVALVDLVGRATLAELLLTAEALDAKRTLSLGLVNRVVYEAQFENKLARGLWSARVSSSWLTSWPGPCAGSSSLISAPTSSSWRASRETRRERIDRPSWQENRPRSCCSTAASAALRSTSNATKAEASRGD